MKLIKNKKLDKIKSVLYQLMHIKYFCNKVYNVIKPWNYLFIYLLHTN